MLPPIWMETTKRIPFIIKPTNGYRPIKRLFYEPFFKFLVDLSSRMHAQKQKKYAAPPVIKAAV